MNLLDLILHVDKYMGEVISQYGALIYILIAAIVFSETGFGKQIGRAHV